MKKNVTIEKKIEFPTMIGEITAISLEHTLQFMDESSIEGDFLLTGRYKLTEASRLEEDFQYKIPTEITLIEKMDLTTSKLDISDFTYDIIEENTLLCHIELTIEGMELVQEESKSVEERECDGDFPSEKEIEIPILESYKEEPPKPETDIEEQKEEDEISENKNFFFNIEDDKDVYGTFVVYLVRQNESLNEIVEKYHTTVDEIEKYNDIKNITMGSKLIIPLIND